tara:strand:- start:370 stop:654 length:285 start_codon:yes stop_codon:yes gene_type:complete
MSETFYEFTSNLSEKIEALAIRSIRRILTHPTLANERRINILRNVNEVTGIYLKIAEMLPKSENFNDEDWRRFLRLCREMGFDPAGLKNRAKDT